MGQYLCRQPRRDRGRGLEKKVTFIKEGREDEDMLRTVSVLKSFAWVTMIRDLRVQRLQKRSEWILRRLWEAFLDPETSRSIIPSDWLQRFEKDRSRRSRSGPGSIW
ncbi:hypothetical protein ACFTAO_04405 [Paenibacillus rhizoplanae]